jgi:hypothetical protein
MSPPFLQRRPNSHQEERAPSIHMLMGSEKIGKPIIPSVFKKIVPANIKAPPMTERILCEK